MLNANRKKRLPKKFELWLNNKMKENTITINIYNEITALCVEFSNETKPSSNETITIPAAISDEKKKTLCNKGTGAGGEQTNINGKKWEYVTCNIPYLKSNGFTVDTAGYLSKKYESYEIIYLAQGGLNNYFMKNHKIKVHRNPDEAYLIKKNDNSFVLKILEKKYQNVEGSVIDKLQTYMVMIEEYKYILKTLNITISYAYCLSKFLQQKLDCNEENMTSANQKFVVWNQNFKKNSIEILYGEDIDYFTKLNAWINDFAISD